MLDLAPGELGTKPPSRARSPGPLIRKATAAACHLPKSQVHLAEKPGAATIARVLWEMSQHSVANERLKGREQGDSMRF